MATHSNITGEKQYGRPHTEQLNTQSMENKPDDMDVQMHN